MERNVRNYAHYWIKKNYGKADRCEFCGVKNARRYEWSNKDHTYKIDRKNWQRLCKPCHAYYDIEKGLRSYEGYRQPWANYTRVALTRFK